MLFKNPVRTSKRTPHFTITKTNWLTLFTEIIAVYSDNHKETENYSLGQNKDLLMVKGSGSHSYHLILKG
jgi:hypothetical protein